MQNINMEQINKMNFNEFEDPIVYFIFRDSLQYLAFCYASLLEAYKCTAGCEMCYVEGYWLSKDDFRNINKDITVEKFIKRARTLKSKFNKLIIADDMFYIRKNFPSIFEAFKSISYNFTSPTVSNNSLFSYLKMNDEITYGSFSNISLTDTFLIKHENRIRKGIETILNTYEEIKSFTLIGTDKRLLEDIRVKDFLKFIKPNVDLLAYSPDFRYDGKVKEVITKLEPFDEIESAVSSSVDEFYSRMECGLYTAGDHFYRRTTNVINPNIKDAITSIYDADESIILKSLKSKIESYKEYSVIMDPNTNPKHYNYFNVVGNQIKVNDEFNFIPNGMLDWSSKIIDNIINNGWVRTEHGLYNSKTNNKEIIGIIERI